MKLYFPQRSQHDWREDFFASSPAPNRFKAEQALSPTKPRSLGSASKALVLPALSLLSLTLSSKG